MKKPWLFRRGGSHGLVAALLVGCASTPRYGAQETSQDLLFREHLTLSTEAINAGDLEGAWAYLREAQTVAANPSQARKVQSLEHLILGAEALRDGDPMLTRVEWSKIDEPSLSADATCNSGTLVSAKRMTERLARTSRPLRFASSSMSSA